MKTWHEYYRDQNKTEVLIKYTVKLPSKDKNFNIDNHPLHVRQKGGEIFVNFHKHISQTLFEDIKKTFECFDKNNIPDELLEKNPGQYIVGYIGDTLPLINKEILDRKYSEGHVIMRTISQFDIYDIFIVDNTGNYHAIIWPNTIPGFPELTGFEKNLDAIFIRDLIDAMTEYFYFNLDECIRKIITSLENYFLHYKLKPKKQNIISRFYCKVKKGSKFRQQVNEFIREKFYDYSERDLRILRDNILSVYNVRNEIVHDKLRMKLSNKIFCKKAIGTLFCIYQSTFTTNDDRRNYIFAFDMQFKMITDMKIGLNLDRFEKAEKCTKKIKIIHNEDELNKSMFESLKISKKETKYIRN